METPYKNLTYEEKEVLHREVYSLGTIGSTHDVNDKLILISLLALTYLKMKEKNPNVKVIDILKSITKQEPDNSYFYQMLEGLAILVEDLSYNCKTADACGLTSSKEILMKIKAILNTWLPF